MSTKYPNTRFHWRLPTDGDSRIKSLGLFDLHSGAHAPVGHFAETAWQRPTDRSGFTYIDYLARVAKAAETAGFDGVLVPNTPAGEEPWIVTGALLRETRTLHFQASFHSAIVKPVHAARASATYQRHSGNRFAWNIVSGENERVQRRYGDFATLEQRFRRTAEFIDIARGVLNNRSFDYDGEIYQVEKGGLQHPVAAVATPRVYLSGSSDVALDIAASHADTYVTWAQPLETLRGSIDRLRERAAGKGRLLSFGLRVDLIVRADAASAWEEARRLWDTADRAALRQRQEISGDDIDSGVEERAFAAPYAAQSDFASSVIGPHLWAAEGLVRPGATVAIVGDYAQAAAILDEYREIGVDEFFLAGAPHLDEAYRVGEEVLPLLNPHVARQAAE